MGTDVPVAISGQLTVEVQPRWSLRQSVGVMPEAYADLLNATVQAFGGWSEPAGDFIDATLGTGVVSRTHFGYEAWRGLEVEAGYGLVLLGANVGDGAGLAAATGREVDPELEALTLSARAALHQLDVAAGWRWAWRQQRLRAQLGFSATLGASAQITPLDQPNTRSGAALWAVTTEATEQELRSWLAGYAHTPTFTVEWAWRVRGSEASQGSEGGGSP